MVRLSVYRILYARSDTLYAGRKQKNNTNLKKIMIKKKLEIKKILFKKFSSVYYYLFNILQYYNSFVA